jgi:hypothetical protein
LSEFSTSSSSSSCWNGTKQNKTLNQTHCLCSHSGIRDTNGFVFGVLLSAHSVDPDDGLLHRIVLAVILYHADLTAILVGAQIVDILIHIDGGNAGKVEIVSSLANEKADKPLTWNNRTCLKFCSSTHTCWSRSPNSAPTPN